MSPGRGSTDAPKRVLLRSVKLRILTVALAATILCGAAASAASAKHPPKIRLALLPLQTAQLGSAGASLPIQFDSGPTANRDAPPQLKKAGRLGGYQLDYGDAYVGGAGVTAIATQVERFRAHAGAKKGLKFWKKEAALLPKIYSSVGLPFSGRFVKVPAIGSGHWAFLTSMQIPNADPLYSVDEEASSGNFVLHASVAAGTESTAEHLAPFLMKKLVHRLRKMLGGTLRGKPAKLPKVPEAGPPLGGPDLSSFVVGPSDFTGQATVVDQGYDVDPSAVSTYGVDLHPAGSFDEVGQEISWYVNANEATWEGTLFAAIFSGNALTPVDLSAVGDNAKGAIGTGEDASGASVSIAVVSMWQGQALDLAIADSPTTIQPADVQALAQAMANHLNVGLGG